MALREYTVIGMTCAHCVRAVSEEVGRIPGVTAVEIDLADGRVTVSSDTALDDEAVVTAVEDAGYEVAT